MALTRQNVVFVYFQFGNFTTKTKTNCIFSDCHSCGNSIYGKVERLKFHEGTEQTSPGEII